MTPLRLGLVFSRGVSLADWSEQGVLHRETALYRRLADLGVETTFFTYGARRDRALAAEAAPIRVRTTVFPRLADRQPRFFALWHRRALRGLDVLKTNQLTGAMAGVFAKRYAGVPLVVRCGYLPSVFYAEDPARAHQAAPQARIEDLACREANLVVCACERDRRLLVSRAGIPEERSTVIPNYVDTEFYRPADPARRRPGRLLFVGRFVDQKNLPLLFEALRGGAAGVTEIVLAGDGPQRESLERLARSLGLPARFAGRLTAEGVRAEMAAAAAFVLPSRYEGTPKALLEAMAAGLPCVATDVVGTREVLRHGEEGLLVPEDPAALAKALGLILGERSLADRLGAGARRRIEAEFSLDGVVAKEHAALRRVAADGAQRS